MPNQAISRKLARGAAALCLIAAVSGCSNLDAREQRTLSAGAIGAGAGALLGVVTGGVVIGTVVGAGAGAAIGAFTDENTVSLDKPAK